MSLTCHAHTRDNGTPSISRRRLPSQPANHIAACQTAETLYCKITTVLYSIQGSSNSDWFGRLQMDSHAEDSRVAPFQSNSEDEGRQTFVCADDGYLQQLSLYLGEAILHVLTSRHASECVYGACAGPCSVRSLVYGCVTRLQSCNLRFKLYWCKLCLLSLDVQCQACLQAAHVPWTINNTCVHAKSCSCSHASTGSVA